ncbi:MAG: flagellar biosynthesis anti-sigma factor FlgM [Planctomycetota bacterium]
MPISGPNQIHSAHGLQGPHGPRAKATPQTAAASQPSTIDQLDISPEAAQAADAGEVRTDRVADIRAQIAQGAYETPEKIDAALDRLLDEIG